MTKGYETTQSLEEYNSDRTVLRVTTERIPNSGNLQKEIALPLGVIVKPYGDPLSVTLKAFKSNFRVRKFLL